MGSPKAVSAKTLGAGTVRIASRELEGWRQIIRLRIDALAQAFGPLDQGLRVNCSRKMVMQVAALRHLQQKRDQQVGVFADALEVASGLGFTRGSGLRGGEGRDSKQDGEGEEKTQPAKRRPSGAPVYSHPLPKEGKGWGTQTIGLGGTQPAKGRTRETGTPLPPSP